MHETLLLKDNAMLAVRPELINEWDFERNNELGLDIYSMTKGSHKMVWWICSDCKSHYDMTVKNKTKGQNCPYCAGKRVNEKNSLKSVYPLIAKQWNFQKNKTLPSDYTSNSGKSVWWICDFGHEYKANINDRAVGNGCPFCIGKKVLVGFNDLWTTEPKIASLLSNVEDGYKYTRQSATRVDWKCPICKHLIKDKCIFTIVNNGCISCPKCSDGRSYPEKFLYNLLLDLNIKFETEKIFDWLKGKRYDFYLPEYETIIEVHGEQHYKSTGGVFNKLEEEQENDRLKMMTALSNNIRHYFVINASKSNKSFLRKSVLDSGLLELLKINCSQLEWDRYDKISMPSMVLRANTLWNKGYHNSEIANELKVSLTTVNKYLKKGAEAGLSDYKADKSRVPSNKALYKKIVQLDLDGNFIKEWKSIKEAGNHFGSKRGSSISSNINKRNKSAYGYKWEYAENYYKKMEEDKNV